MPYDTIKLLPDAVRHVLPIGAQKIYLATFNHAWEEYKDPQKRRGGGSETQEEVAHKVAWAAVKKKYVKKGDMWEEK